MAQQSPREALTDCHAKDAQVVPPATTRSTTSYEDRLNAPMFRPQKSQRTCSWAMGNRPDGLTLVLAKCSQPDTGRHSCRQPSRLLHVNHVSDTMRSGRSSSTAKENNVRQYNPAAYFRSNRNQDTGTNKSRWSTLIRQPQRIPFVPFVSFHRSK